MKNEYIDETKKIDTYEIHNGVIENVKYKEFNNEIEKDVQYCAEVMAEMYDDISFEKAKELLWNSPFPEIMKEDPVFGGHISFQRWSEWTYDLHKKLGNI